MALKNFKKTTQSSVVATNETNSTTIQNEEAVVNTSLIETESSTDESVLNIQEETPETTINAAPYEEYNKTEYAVLKLLETDGIIKSNPTLTVIVNTDRAKKQAITYGATIDGNTATFKKPYDASRYELWNLVNNSAYNETPFNDVINGFSENAVFVDTETTGFNGDDEIIEFGITDIYANQLIREYFKPTNSVDFGAMKCNHILTSSLSNECNFLEKWPEIKAVLNNATQVVIFNADYDLRMLRQTLEKYNADTSELAFVDELDKKTVDAMKFPANTIGKTRISLQNAADMCGIDYIEKHNAVSDCYLTIAMLRNLLGTSQTEPVELRLPNETVTVGDIKSLDTNKTVTEEEPVKKSGATRQYIMYVNSIEELCKNVENIINTEGASYYSYIENPKTGVILLIYRAKAEIAKI